MVTDVAAEFPLPDLVGGQPDGAGEHGVAGQGGEFDGGFDEEHGPEVAPDRVEQDASGAGDTAADDQGVGVDGEQHGSDGEGEGAGDLVNKKTPGRKRGLAVDVLGLIIGVVVLAASAHDNEAGIVLLDQAAERCGMRLEKVLVDQGFTAPWSSTGR